MLHPNFHPEISKLLIDNKDRKSIILALFLTDRCNINCDFCCRPPVNQDIDIEHAKNIINSAHQSGLNANVHFSGGEVFLRKAELIELLKLCKQNQQFTAVVTNGFWAKTPEIADQIVKELISAGLCSIKFSWDYAHGKFISPETIQNGIDAAMNNGMLVELRGSFPQAACENGIYFDSFGFNITQYAEYENFCCTYSYISMTGNAKDHYNELPIPGNPSSLKCPESKCGTPFITFHKQDYKVLPCCSTETAYDNTGLAIGFWHDTENKNLVSDLIYSYHQSPYLNTIKNDGFEGLYSTIQEKAPHLLEGLPNLPDFSDPCQVCARVTESKNFPAIKKLLLSVA
jgi:hypothetical protein